MRGKKKTSREISLYEPVGTDREGNEIQLFDMIVCTEENTPDIVTLKENISTLYQKLDEVLTPREHTVLKMRYGLYNADTFTQREIADHLKISRSYVSRIEKSALQKLKMHFD